MREQIDCKAIFARELHSMIPVVFESHGIDKITEEQLDDTIAMAVKVYDSTVYEFRKKFGIGIVPQIRLW